MRTVVVGVAVLIALVVAVLLLREWGYSVSPHTSPTAQGPGVVTRTTAQPPALAVSQVPPSAVAGGDADRARRLDEAYRQGEVEFKETVTRNIALEYGPFFARHPTKPETRDLALKALGDQFSSSTDAEKRDYDELLERLLGPDDFKSLKDYRDHLPLEEQVKAGFDALALEKVQIGSDEGDAIRAAMEKIPPRNPLSAALLQQAEISDQDIARLRASYESTFDKAFAGAAVGPAALATLRNWYLGQHVSSEMQIVRIQQLMLAEKKRAR